MLLDKIHARGQSINGMLMLSIRNAAGLLFKHRDFDIKEIKNNSNFFPYSCSAISARHPIGLDTMINAGARVHSLAPELRPFNPHAYAYVGIRARSERT